MTVGVPVTVVGANEGVHDGIPDGDMETAFLTGMAVVGKGVGIAVATLEEGPADGIRLGTESDGDIEGDPDGANDDGDIDGFIEPS